MASQVKQKCLDIRGFVSNLLGSWTDPNPELNQDNVEDLDDPECQTLLNQIYEKVKKPRREVGDI